MSERGYFYTDPRTIISITDDNDVEINLPMKWEICSRCHGDGHHGNPAFDGLSPAEAFDGDEEFAEEYFAGKHDVNCEDCGGEGKQKVVDESKLDALTLKKYRRAQQEITSANNESAMERRMGA